MSRKSRAGDKSAARKRFISLAAVSVLALTAACASPEQKVERYSKDAGELLEKGDYAKAYIQYQNVLKIDEEHVPSLLGLAEIAEERKDFQAMFGFLQRVVRLDPTQTEAYVKLGKLYLIGSDETTALENAEKALAIDPTNIGAKGVKAGVLLKAGDKNGAVALAKEILATDPVNAEAITVLATVYSLNGDYDAAVAEIDKGLKSNPKIAILQLLRIHLLKTAGREDEARESYVNLIDVFPEQTAYRRVYANELLKLKDFAGARAQLEEISKLEPNNDDIKLDIVRIIKASEGDNAAENAMRAYAEAQPNNTRLQFSLSDYYASEKKPEKAREVLEKLAKNSDQDIVLRAKNKLASFLFNDGKRAEAVAMIDEILAADQRNTEALLKKAAIEIEDGSIDQAVVNLRTALDNDPANYDAMILMSAAFEKQNNISFAQAELAKAFEGSKYNARVTNQYARFLLRQKNLERADEVLSESLEANPGDVENLRLLASIRLAQRDWRGAEEIGAQLEQTTNAADLASEVKSAAYIGLEDYESVISTLTGRAESGSLSPRPLTALIAAYLREDRDDEAKALLDRVIASDPKNYTAQMLLARVYSKKKDADGYQGALLAATKVDPERAEAFEFLYRSYLAQGRIDDAQKLIDDGIATAPRNDALRVYKADLLLSRGDRAGALALYSELIKVRPDDQIIANNFVSLSSDLRLDAESVARALDIAKRIEGLENPFYRDTAGWAYYRAGEYPRAIELLSEAVAGASNNAEMLYHLGAAQAASGDTAAAKANLEKAQANAGPNSPFEADLRALLERL
ncbi:MAG: tetratricopeptide repeat protein [Parvularculaceae bacterium]